MPNSSMTPSEAETQLAWIDTDNGSLTPSIARRALETVVAQAGEIAELARARDAALVDAQDYKIRLNALLDDEEDHYG